MAHGQSKHVIHGAQRSTSVYTKLKASLDYLTLYL